MKAKATKLPIYIKELIPERINKCHGLAFGFSKGFIFYILSVFTRVVRRKQVRH